MENKALKTFDALAGAVSRQDEAHTTVGEDGLLQCTKCGGKLEVRIKNAGPLSGVKPCLCPCLAEESRKKRQEAEERERIMRIQSLIADGVEDKALLNYTFEKSTKDTLAIKVARWYVDTWEDQYKDGMGLMFHGNVGTGKSYASACIANALLSQGKSVLLTSIQKVVAGIPSMFSGEINRYFERLGKYQLLVLDDLGVSRETDYITEQVYSLVDERYKSGKPLVLTTNLTPEEMKTCKNIEWRRIYDRLFEMCMPIKVDGESMRQAATKSKAGIMRQRWREYARGTENER